jgi:hypothetical protein
VKASSSSAKPRIAAMGPNGSSFISFAVSGTSVKTVGSKK